MRKTLFQYLATLFFFVHWLMVLPHSAFAQNASRADCTDCNRLSDSLVLCALYEQTGGPNWVHSDNWMSDRPLEEWFGVHTNSRGCVVDLDLDGIDDPNFRTSLLGGNGLSGELPALRLDCLERLFLTRNDLKGPLPDLSRSTCLREVYLDDNSFTGGIPADWSSLVNLEALYIEDNQLTEKILDIFPSSWTKLQQLNANNNFISEPIPDFFAIPSMEFVDVGENNLTFDDILAIYTTYQMRERQGEGLWFGIDAQKCVYKDTVIRVGVGTPLVIDILTDASLTSNIHHWRQISRINGDTILYPPSSSVQWSIDSIGWENQGQYFCRITNEQVDSMPTDENETFLFLETCPFIRIEPCSTAVEDIDLLLCPGDSLLVKGQVFTRDTMARIIERGVAAQACDSVYQIRLRYVQPVAVQEDTICRGEFLDIQIAGIEQRFQRSIDTILRFPNGSVFGCDSIVDLRLRMADANTFDFANAGEDQYVCIDETELFANAVADPLLGNWTVQTGAANLLDVTSATNIVSGLGPGENTLTWQVYFENCLVDEDTLLLYYEPPFRTLPESFVASSGMPYTDTLDINGPLRLTTSWQLSILESTVNGELRLLQDSIFTYTSDIGFIGVDSFQYRISSDLCPMHTREVMVGVAVQPSIDTTVIRPNVISPNEDGLNDRFIIPELEEDLTALGENELLIFTRRGRLIYKDDNYQNDWNGLDMRMQQVPAGVYFYLFIHERRPKGERGSIEVLRAIE